MRKFFFIPLFIGLIGLIAACGNKQANNQANETPQFVEVRNGEFYIGDSVYRYLGTNFWYGAILASEGRGGDRQRLLAELDSLQALGLNNLRILAGGDGNRTIDYHIEPNLQVAPGVYNDTLLQGLDYLLAELEKRDMKAVIYLNNTWEWSGGFGTYLEWVGEGVQPLPNVDGYKEFCDFTAKFMLNDSAKNLAIEHAKNIVGRVNTVTGKPYSESPAIMSWQIANEPRCFSQEGKEKMYEWIVEYARQIKNIDPNHLVSTGSEGKYGCENDIELWKRIHTTDEIDYATIHIWPFNWQWARKDSLYVDLENSNNRTLAYIIQHSDSLRGTGKPLVLEEFGFPRDGREISLDSPTGARDIYYKYVFDVVADSARLNGVNFWGWGGNVVPPEAMWHAGDPYTGDPAQEDQGLYSVFATDSSTVAIIREASKKINTRN